MIAKYKNIVEENKIVYEDYYETRSYNKVFYFFLIISGFVMMGIDFTAAVLVFFVATLYIWVVSKHYLVLYNKEKTYIIDKRKKLIYIQQQSETMFKNSGIICNDLNKTLTALSRGRGKAMTHAMYYDGINNKNKKVIEELSKESIKEEEKEQNDLETSLT